MKKILSACILALTLLVPASGAFAQATPAKISECKGYTYGSSQWKNKGCTDLDVHSGVCDSFADNFKYWADFVGTTQYNSYRCDIVDNGKYSNDKPPAASCDVITSQNYNSCCTAPAGGFQSGFDYEPSQACIDFKNQTSAQTQGTTSKCSPVLPQETLKQNGCDKDELIRSGRLAIECQSLTANSTRWKNLGCDNISLTAGQIGGTTPPTGPQNTSAASDAGFRGSSSKELESCSSIKFKSLLDILIWAKCVIVAAIIPLIFVLAFLFFLWGVLRFMMASDQKNKDESKKMMWWGMVGLFVMISVWGIIKIVGNVLGIESAVPLLKTDYLDDKNANR